MQTKHFSLMVPVLLAGLSLLGVGHQAPPAKKPPQAKLPQVLVVRPQPGSQAKLPEKTPRMRALPAVDKLKLLRDALGPAQVTSTSAYLTQYAPQLCTNTGQFIYYNARQVDCGLAYFWANDSNSPKRNGSLEFRLRGDAGHRYLVELFAGWPDGGRKFQVSSPNSAQTTMFTFYQGGLMDMPVIVDLSTLPSGWYTVRVGPPPEEDDYGGHWFFVGVVVSLVQ